MVVRAARTEKARTKTAGIKESINTDSQNRFLLTKQISTHSFKLNVALKSVSAK